MKIVTFPAEVLRQKAEVVEDFTGIPELTQKMIQLMQKSGGVGLAAPQIALSQRILVASPTGKPADAIVVVNPSIVSESVDREFDIEGCLSLPGIQKSVSRPTRIRVKCQDQRGDFKEIRANGMLARIILHEMDHLNGKLIIDYPDPQVNLIG